MDRIRVAFIGAGRHANNAVYPSLRYAPIDLVAIAALGEEEAERTARTFGAPRYYVGGFEEMLRKERDNIDACIVVVSPPSYRAIIPAVLDAGLPVYAEKPASGSVAEAREIEELARKAGKPVQVGFMKRFAPAYRMAKAAMGREAFGKASHFVGKFAVGGGLYPDEYTYLVDNPIHLIDLARFFMGEVTRVTVERSEPAEKRWSYGALLRFASGATGALHFANTQSWRKHNEFVEITGVGHFTSVDNVVRYQFHAPDGPGESWEPNHTVPSAANSSLMFTGYAHELIHFAQVVREGIPPEAGIHDARRALELIDEIFVQGGGVLEPGRTAAAW